MPPSGWQENQCIQVEIVFILMLFRGFLKWARVMSPLIITYAGGILLKTECTGKPTEMENPSVLNNFFPLSKCWYGYKNHI